MEFASVDPKLGTIFYTLDQEQSGTPRLQRRTTDCVLCHDGASTGGVPGLMVRSVYPDNEGNAILRAGTFFTTDHSPWRERWGGWYVTGTHGDEVHMGNLLAPNHVNSLGTSAETYVSQINLFLGSNIKDVRDNFESSRSSSCKSSERNRRSRPCNVFFGRTKVNRTFPGRIAGFEILKDTKPGF